MSLRHLGQPVPEEAVEWLRARCLASGGFLAAPAAPMPDLLSTATALHALAATATPLDDLREPCLDFIDSLWDPRGGFHGTWADDALDCEYVFYGLLALGHLTTWDIGVDRAALTETLANTRHALLAERLPSGHWEGELCSSALSTATAASALALVDRDASADLVCRGTQWLADHGNADGGWGDSVLSRSNISTTVLCWCAFAIAGTEDEHRETVARAEAWIERAAGGLEPDTLAQAIAARYGRDHTFSVPILATCAIAGKLGEGRAAWRHVAPLPFELAAPPHSWLKFLRVPVVSYALPALVAIGHARFHHLPPRNPVTRLARILTRGKALRKLTAMQPDSGGFLEATPLTSFVTMNLAAAGLAGHPVARKAVGFLRASARDDGSWPIDTNLATWVTTLSVNALAAAPDFAERVPVEERRAVLDWLLDQQHCQVHPFTNADPGGWAWTDLSGGVPDADDTAGALLALRSLGIEDDRILPAAEAALEWLGHLQNKDSGIPTFCRGWGRLPFDRSGADLTAHALMALDAWLDDLPDRSWGLSRTEGSLVTIFGRDYLETSQRPDGSWVPLWFGNEAAPDEENPVFGTARVLQALSTLLRRAPFGMEALRKGAGWLLEAQTADGGWGGAPGVGASIEETALAVDALARVLVVAPRAADGIEEAISRGVAWLIAHTDCGQSFPPSPIGFYFAKLWYYERLYPLVFACSALERVNALLALGQGA